jgi:hypothetical protein
MPANGSDRATVMNWIRDLTFAEAHAMTYGIVHGTAMVVAWTVGYTDVALALLVLAFLLNGWVQLSKWRDKTGAVERAYKALPKSIVGQIRSELHYYDGAFVLASAAMFFAVSLVGYNPVV